MTSFFLFLFSLGFLLFSEPVNGEYVKSPHIPQSIWEKVQPYFLPDNHPIKPTLDRLFTSSRATLNSSTLSRAGFKNTTPGQYSQCVVTTHSKIPGYYFKIILDTQPGKSDWEEFVKRAYGAKTLQEAIDKFGYHALYKVPQKWIYPLPSNPSPPNGLERKNFILIAEDVGVVHEKKNRSDWKNDNITNKQRLQALYTLLKDQGLSDSIHCFNVPFCRDGRNAFIDTEYNHIFPVSYSVFLRYLSPKGQALWHEIIAKE